MPLPCCFRWNIKQGRLNGAVLIGNIAIQGQLRKVLESKVDCLHLTEQMLEPKWKAEEIISQCEPAQGAPASA